MFEDVCIFLVAPTYLSEAMVKFLCAFFVEQRCAMRYGVIYT